MQGPRGWEGRPCRRGAPSLRRTPARSGPEPAPPDPSIPAETLPSRRRAKRERDRARTAATERPKLCPRCREKRPGGGSGGWGGIAGTPSPQGGSRFGPCPPGPVRAPEGQSRCRPGAGALPPSASGGAGPGAARGTPSRLWGSAGRPSAGSGSRPAAALPAGSQGPARPGWAVLRRVSLGLSAQISFLRIKKRAGR